MTPLWLRRFRDRVRAMSPIRRAAITFAMQFPIALVIFWLGWRVFNWTTPEPPMPPSLLLTEAGSSAIVMAILAYVGVFWGDGPAQRES